jgi:phosphomannomutase
MVGSIFKAYDIRATYPEPLNEEAGWKVGLASGQFFLQQAKAAGADSNSVCVSRDMRPSSPSMCKALIDGLLASGVDVIDLGMADTSIQYFAINYLGCIGGIQTTASHNPIHYNGFKLSGLQAKPIGANTGLKDIQAMAERLPNRANYKSSITPGNLSTRDIWTQYKAHILKFFTPSNRILKVFVDASNGMAGQMVPKVFEDLPTVKIAPVNFETNGKFVHEPNPLVAKNMVPTQEGVIKHSAHFGACFDGDADRCIFTDETGRIIGCDHLTGLFAEYFLKTNPGSTVVYDLRSSKAVEETVHSLGGKTHRSRVGHVFMKADLRHTSAVFGGELSGHFYFRDNFFADSGAIAFAVMLTILSQTDTPLSQLIAPYRRYPQSGEQNFVVQDKSGVFSWVKETFGKSAKLDELDGVSVDSWDTLGYAFNIRASNTEPLMRLNAEAKDKNTLAALLELLTPKLGTPDSEGH